MEPKTKKLLNLFIKCDEIKGNNTSIKNTNELKSKNIIDMKKKKRKIIRMERIKMKEIITIQSH